MTIEEFIKSSDHIMSYVHKYESAIEDTSIHEVVEKFIKENGDSLKKLLTENSSFVDQLKADVNVDVFVNYCSTIKTEAPNDPVAAWQWNNVKHYYASALAVIRDDIFILENYPQLRDIAKATNEYSELRAMLAECGNRQIGSVGYASTSSTSWWKTMAVGAGAIVLAACVIAVINVAVGGALGIAALAAL